MQECRNGCVGNSEINPIREKKRVDAKTSLLQR